LASSSYSCPDVRRTAGVKQQRTHGQLKILKEEC
jgi:hypothetical protein